MNRENSDKIVKLSSGKIVESSIKRISRHKPVNYLTI
jgi:hypothetical protein